MKMEETCAYCERCAKLVDWFKVDEMRDPPVWLRRCSNMRCEYYGRLDILIEIDRGEYHILASHWIAQPKDMLEFASPKEMMR